MSELLVGVLGEYIPLKLPLVRLIGLSDSIEVPINPFKFSSLSDNKLAI
jgi:hypothetical protein